MRRTLVCLALCACTAAPGVAPVVQVAAVILYQDTVNVLMDDGSLCVLDRPGREPSWTGTTAGCPYDLPVAVNGLASGPRDVLRRGGDKVTVSGEGWG